MGKIIFINRYFYPDHSATSQMLTDLAFELARNNTDVRIITSRQVYDKPLTRLPARESINGVGINRVWTTSFGRARLWGRALDYLSFYLSAAWRLAVTVSRGDVVVAKTDPPLISVVAAAVAKLRGAVLINWVQDLFPEVATALKVKGIMAIASTLRWIRNLSLRAAKTNVVLGERMGQKLISQGVKPGNVTVIHNWSDGEDIKPVPRETNRLRHEWGLHDELVVGYSGNMGRAHEFKTIIDAATSLQNDRRIVFLFIGDGAQRESVEQETKKRGLGNVIFKPYQARSKLGLSLCVPDLHVISLQPELEGLIVPSKFYGIAAAGRPTLYIGDPSGEIAAILEKEGCGVSVRIGDPDAVVRALHELLANKELLMLMGGNARKTFEREYDKEVAFAAWKQLLKNVTVS